MQMTNFNSLRNSNDLLWEGAYRGKHAGGQRCREPWSWLLCPSFHAGIKPVRAVSVQQPSSQLSGIRWWSSMRVVAAIKPPKLVSGWHRSPAASVEGSHKIRLGLFATVPVNTLLSLLSVKNVVDVEMTIDEAAIQSFLAFLSLTLM